MKYNNPLTDKIFEILSPLVGASMAIAALEIQAKKAGVSAETINKNHVPQIAEWLSKSLVVFLGRDGARKIESRIKAISM